jgi:hypothetical protein
MAGEFCIAYLNFLNFDSQIMRFKENTNTDIAALNKIANKGALISSDNPGHSAVQFWNTFRHRDTKINMDLTRILPKKSPVHNFSSFEFLSYIVSHWLWHFTDDHYGKLSDRNIRSVVHNLLVKRG